MRHPPLPDDPDALRGPGGLTLREVHALVQQSVERDKATLSIATPPPRGLAARVANWWKRRRGPQSR